MRLLRRQAGVALIELLTYIAVVAVIVTVAWLSYFRYVNASTTLLRAGEDIVSALRAGERWREDIRAATAEPTLAAGTLRVPQGGAEVLYRLRGDAVERKGAEGGWMPVLMRVKASAMQADQGSRVRSWRWEVELAAASGAARRDGALRPRFTFMAVAPSGAQR